MASGTQGVADSRTTGTSSAIQAFVISEDVCDPPHSRHVVRYGVLKLVILFEDGTERRIRIDKREPRPRTSTYGWRRCGGGQSQSMKNPTVNQQLKDLGVPLRHTRESNGEVKIEVTKPPFCLCAPDGGMVERLVFKPAYVLH